jgi:hypothetical protein
MAKLKMDGFVNISDQDDITNNLERCRNEFSPFSSADRIQPDLHNPLIVDSYYGQIYNSWIGEVDAIYGRTDELPEYSGDFLADYGFLRVPFRRIPRCLIHDRQDLDFIVKSIHSADEDLIILFRGQNKEYLLNRSPETLKILYGDANALEPSLLSSASRRGIKLEEVITEWCCLLQLYIGLQKKKIISSPSKITLDSILDSYDTLQSSYSLRLFAYALAQHYGLPSPGLDATNRLDVALFFALTEIKSDSKGNSRYYICKSKSSKSEPAVIYLFAPKSRFELNYDECRPKGFPITRPDAQSAHFLLSGWGLNRNSCARNLFMALYLDPNGDFGDIPIACELFPERQKDSFGEFLEYMAQKPLPNSISRFLGDFRWVLCDSNK